MEGMSLNPEKRRRGWMMTAVGVAVLAAVSIAVVIAIVDDHDVGDDEEAPSERLKWTAEQWIVEIVGSEPTAEQVEAHRREFRELCAATAGELRERVLDSVGNETRQLQLEAAVRVECPDRVREWAGYVAEQIAEEARRSSVAEVAYFVEGTARSVQITAETPTGIQQNIVDLPLKNKQGGLGLHFEFLRGEFLYISAQNQGAIGTVTCRIEVDGQPVSINTSSGPYSIVTCEGSA